MIHFRFLDMSVTGLNRKTGFNRNTGRSYNTKRYKEFCKELVYRMREQYTGVPIIYNISLAISLFTYYDIDNLLKPILDSLEAAGVIENDRQVTFLVVSKHPKKRGSLSDIVIRITEAQDEKDIPDYNNGRYTFTGHLDSGTVPTL